MKKPMELSYLPELDDTPELDSNELILSQELIAVFRGQSILFIRGAITRRYTPIQGTTCCDDSLC